MLDAIAATLRSHQKAVGQSTHQLAELACCSEAEVDMVLRGDLAAPSGIVAAVCEVLGCDLLAVPKPAARAVRAGPDVTEPKVDTVVSSALRQLTLPVTSDGKVHVPGSTDVAAAADIHSWFEYWDACRQHPDVPIAADIQGRREALRLTIHHAAVQALRQRPELAEQALRALERWMLNGFPDHSRAAEWRRLIEAGDWEPFICDTEDGRRLRVGSPLPCVIAQEERRRIIHGLKEAPPFSDLRQPPCQIGGRCRMAGKYS
jgi:hypothetical protein